MADQTKQYRWDGSYDFKKREDWDYRHGFGFMAGGLGQEAAKAEIKRKKKLGTVDETAPPLPKDNAFVETIEKTARHIHKSNDPPVFERLIQDKNKGKPGWNFLAEGEEGYEYYTFVRHCLEREVDPRPLALQARKVKEDRELKQANTKANVFTGYAGPTAEVPKKTQADAKFRVGEFMEVLGVKSKPDYNGKIVKVMGYVPEADRYEVRFEGGRYNTVVVKLKEENLMYSSVQQKDVDEKKSEVPEGEIPNGMKVEISGLESDAAKWMNGQKAIIVCWDKDVERYELRLEINNAIKKVKAGNIRPEVPEGWEEHYDEHLGRHYYVNKETQKVTWKHPTVTNTRAKFGKVKENLMEDFAEVELDEKRQHYEVDEEEEMEGQFNLDALVKKVEEQEAKREAAEEAGEDGVDSDDGLHEIKKPKKKKQKKEKVTAELVIEKVMTLIEHTFTARESIKRDYSLLDGNFCARDFEPVMKEWEALERISEAPDPLCKKTFEIMLALIQRAAELTKELSVARLQLIELNKIVNRVTTIEKREELYEDAKWVHAYLKTM